MQFFYEKFLNALQNITGRYFVFATIIWVLFYVILYTRIKDKKIQSRMPSRGDQWREIMYSLGTMVIFAIISALFIGTPLRAYTQFYKDINEHSMFYFWAAFPIMFLIHDTYFYWMHRIMHHPQVFKWVHVVHHKSTNPSPWAAYAFHPLESFVEMGIFIIFIFIMPIHYIHLFGFFTFSVLYNMYGHLGWELYPKGFSKSRIGRWVNTSVSHNQHHQYFTGNYGLYLLVWDRWMGTLRRDYDTQFDKVKS